MSVTDGQFGEHAISKIERLIRIVQQNSDLKSMRKEVAGEAFIFRRQRRSRPSSRQGIRPAPVREIEPIPALLLSWLEACGNEEELMVSVKGISRCSLLPRKQRRSCPEKEVFLKRAMAAGILSALIFCPICGVADEKTETPQAVESSTGTAGQTSDQNLEKKQTSKDQTLEPIVVTATKSEKSIADSPAAVSVVTSADIESRHIETVDQAINDLPGVFAQRVSQLDSIGDIMMRGMPLQERNLVLLDGERLNQAFAGLVNWNSLNPLDIARIEVVRGPFSSLYGGDAMGGVINIITKTPQQREITIQSGYQSYNTWSEYASYGDKLCNRLSVFTSFGYKQSDGYPNIPVVVYPGYTPGGTPVHGAIPSTDAFGNSTYIIGNTGDYNWWTQSGSLKLVYDINPDSKATFSYRNNEWGYGWGTPQSYLFDSHGNNVFSGNLSFNGVPISATTSDFVSGVTRGGFMENIFHGDYQTKIFGDAVLKITGGAINTPTNWYTQPSPNATNDTHFGGPGQYYSTPSNSYDVDVQLSYPLLEKHLLIFGAAYRYDEASQPVTNLGNWTESATYAGPYSDSKGKDAIYSFYTQAEIALLSKLTLYAGVRGDYWTTFDGFSEIEGVQSPTSYGSNSDFSANPKGSLVYKPWDGTTFRSSVGTAFRPPTVYELYTSWSGYGIFSEANPNLKPETTFSWDIGAEQKLGSNTVCKLNYFKNTLSNYIYWASVNGSYSVFQNQNAGKAETDGIEFEIENKPLDCLKLFSNTTYIHSEMLSNSFDPTSVGKQLQYVPAVTFNAGGELTYGKFSFTMTGRYADKQYGYADNADKVSGVYGSYDRYFTADCKLRYKLTDWGTLDFGINNLLDEKYFTYYQAPGRQFFGGVTAKF
jgi:iron complex outermembrane receptor protein